jgi:hypothetical protein
MNKFKHIGFLFLILFAACTNAIGQAKITASCKYSKVPMGTSFQVVYTVTDGQASNFTKPSFDHFNFNGPYTSSNVSMSFNNGTMIQESEETYTYVLTPTSTGKFIIDAAKALVKGSWIESNTISIEVTASGSSAANANNNTTSKPKSSTSSSTSNANASNNDIYVKAFVDKTNPYVGEQVVVTYKLYTRLNVSQLGIDKIPAFTDFWSQDLTKESDKSPQTYENIGGSQYLVVEIRKIALFPQKSGPLSIDPLKVECVVQEVSKQKSNDPFSSFFNDPFFNNSFFNTYANVKKDIYSNAVSIYAKPLPVANQPAEFKNNVGSFTLEATIDKTNVKTNDAVNLTYKVSGIGNISLIDKPDFDFPADLETYDPNIKENVVPSAGGISGSKTFSYLIIPRSAGDFTIKPVNFCYFDLARGSYVTLTTPEFKLKVEKGSGDNTTTVTSANKEDIKYLNSDIRYIKNNTILLTEVGSFFYGSPLFFLLLLAPIILFILFVVIYRKKLKENSNIALMRNKKATGVARKRLKTASIFLKENKKEPFLDEVFKALWGYLSDKLSIPIAELSKETVNDKFIEKNVHEDIATQFISTLNNCEYARFAPADSSVTLDTIYNEAIDIITKMEKELR